ncbi:hypothetical protein KBD59_04830 [Candidatus Gracilibacteria bacterium]|nr:hypothetical protein [Candidatus Gracilibacteria bacterium]
MNSNDSNSATTDASPQSSKPPPDDAVVASQLQKTQQEIDDQTDKLKSKIYASRPIFGRIIKKHGAKSLYDYSKEFFDINKDLRLESRRPVCLHVIYETVKKRLGKKIASEVERQLLRRPMVNTTDHHAIIGHPFFLNTNIITALPYPEMKRRSLKYLVTFSFASVSLNNASGFARGFLFHGGDQGEGPLIRLPLLPDKWKMRPVYGTPAYTRDDLAHARKQLMNKQKEGLLTARRARLFDEQVLGVLEQAEILNSEDFSEQISKINFQLWPKYFNSNGSKIPDLIYIEAESMTREILTKEILKESTCLLYKMLFDPTVRELFLKYFEGLPGTFSKDNGWGTYFFWGFDEKQHRIRLDVENGKLLSKAKGYEIQLEPEALSQALEKKEIFPSMMTIYLTLSLHYGFKCLGGFSQVHDLTKMKEALLHVLVDLGRFREIHSVCRIQTKELSGDGLVLSYIENEKKQLVPAMGLDLLLSEKKLSYDDYISLSKQVTLEEMMAPLVPEIYTVLYPSYLRTGGPEESLQPEEIMRATGLQTKMDNLFHTIYNTTN